MPSSAFYDLCTPLIPWRHQPALLLDHLQSLDIEAEAALPGTGLKARDLADPATCLTPAQYLRLLGNAAQRLGSPETALRLGQTALPGHFGAASHALMHAASLRSVLDVLVAHPARLSPLLTPRLVVEGRHAVLYWTESCGAAAQRAFLVELHMSAIRTLCDWRAGEPLPWGYCFNRHAPARLEALRVHLGRQLRFGCRIDAMVIDAAWLDRAWPAQGHPGAARMQQALSRQAHAEDGRRGLLALLYDHLLARIAEPPGLEETARDFGLSATTFKRRLLANGTHFQAELDQVRAHVALWLMQGRGQDNEAVAQHLGIADPANFRRAFKRWTGTTPSRLRDSIGASFEAFLDAAGPQATG